MTELIINFLFRLLGNTYTRQYHIPYLFGAHSQNHEARKKRWEKALVRLYKDKELLDFLYYQVESDKENAWRGKIDRKLTQGARIRTLFLIHSAHMAYLTAQLKGKTASDISAINTEKKNLEASYRRTVDISAPQGNA